MKHVILKSIIIVVGILAFCGGINAKKVYTNTLSPKDWSLYDGKTIDLTVYRYIFKGWNTLCLPFAMTEAQINEAFGDDCRLESLVGVESAGNNTTLNFKDVKRDGIMANTPYILYSTKESGVRTIHIPDAYITLGDVEQRFVDNVGDDVAFSGAMQKQGTEGIYGILAKANADAAFVDASTASNIYSTRCYIKLNGGELKSMLTSNHLDYNMTGLDEISAGADTQELFDVYNVSGIRIAKSISLPQMQSLGKGVYVVKGKKVWIK